MKASGGIGRSSSRTGFIASRSKREEPSISPSGSAMAKATKNPEKTRLKLDIA
ncbi:hypothetical protein GCM10010918_19760 [Paenibacillus radicis (ex Gao et al. 2016)]|uniref:Uncharacterized protein n=1 Tax=Paenibacillus radicis (ex Gao et al. 2016) TaxID=1737354 RepID=A0A917H2R7_9BACL|nr:hypothetical protein GCM10010918_19760 [Paenibacillus radicis (ex Gao et al. 2016)]